MSKVQYLNPPGLGPAQGLYSMCTLLPAGSDTYHIAGQLAVGKDGNIVGVGDFKAQFHQVFTNLGDLLKVLGEDFNSVVIFRTYLVHSQSIPIFMQERKALFPKLFKTSDYPPNTLLMIDRLVKEEFLIELEAIAIKTKK